MTAPHPPRPLYHIKMRYYYMEYPGVRHYYPMKDIGAGPVPPPLGEDQTAALYHTYITPIITLCHTRPLSTDVIANICWVLGYIESSVLGLHLQTHGDRRLQRNSVLSVPSDVYDSPNIFQISL